jgi:DNA-binding transcriptional LysR family regulator
MTQAAEELHVAQPSLSRTISRLEEELGVTLFDRVGRQIQLNDYGKVLLVRVERVFKELEDVKRELSDLSDTKECTVSLAVNTSIFMPDLLKKFSKQYPHIQFRQMLATTAHIQHLLEIEQVDFGISVPPIVPLESENIQTLPLLTTEIFLAVPPHHPLLVRESISLRDVANEPFISMPIGYGLREMTDTFCHQASFIPNIVIESNEPYSIIRYVQAGLGFAFIPPSLWEPSAELTKGLLRIQDTVCKGTVGLSWKKDRYISQAARQFQEFIVSYFYDLEKKI